MSKPDVDTGRCSVDRLVRLLNGELPRASLGFDADTGMEIIGLDRKALVNQRREAARVIDEMRKALEEIAKFYQCLGPNCHWCESELAHPASAEARIAKEILDELNMPNVEL